MAGTLSTAPVLVQPWANSCQTFHQCRFAAATWSYGADVNAAGIVMPKSFKKETT